VATFGGIRGLAQAFIRSAVAKGLSSTATLKSLVDGGISYRRTNMLADYREWGQVPRKMSAIKAVRRDYLPSQSAYVETTGKQTQPYRYQITGNIYNPETGERVDFTTNVVSEFGLTPNQVYDEALEPIKASTEAYKSEIEHYTIEAAFHRIGSSWD